MFPRRRFLIPALIAALFGPLANAAEVIGQVPEPSEAPRGRTMRAAPRPNQPDPALFDGSSEEPEQRPDQGMLADFEMPGDNEQSDQVGPSPGEAGGPQGTGEQAASSAGGGPPPEAADPNAEAEGIEVANLEIPEGAEPLPQEDGPEKPKEISLGDATMQIEAASGPQTADGGGQQAPSDADQLQKGSTKGNSSTDNRNRGVERGRAIPSGL